MHVSKYKSYLDIYRTQIRSTSQLPKWYHFVEVMRPLFKEVCASIFGNSDKHAQTWHL